MPEIVTIYENFTSGMVSVLENAGLNIYHALDDLQNKSRSAQLFGIPGVLALYTPIFESFSYGTNIVLDWHLAIRASQGPGPYVCRLNI